MPLRMRPEKRLRDHQAQYSVPQKLQALIIS
jgi:hypothetical protein